MYEEFYQLHEDGKTKKEIATILKVTQRKVTEVLEKKYGAAADSFESPVYQQEIPLEPEPVIQKRAYTKRKVAAPEAQEESSLPHQAPDIQERTQGYQPRSHYANSRQAMMRPTEELRSQIQKQLLVQSNSRLHIGKEEIPEGLVTLWARRFLMGMNNKTSADSANIPRLLRKHWKPAFCDMFPGLAFVDEYGNLDDSQDIIKNHEYDLLWREDWIHEMEEDIFRNQTRKKAKAPEQALNRSQLTPDMMPFAYQHNESRPQESSNYASTPLANRYMQEHQSSLPQAPMPPASHPRL